jgi:hypothetical protein
MGGDVLSVDDIRGAVLERHQLALPANTRRTLLDRVARGGFLRRRSAE